MSKMAKILSKYWLTNSPSISHSLSPSVSFSLSLSLFLSHSSLSLFLSLFSLSLSLSLSLSVSLYTNLIRISAWRIQMTRFWGKLNFGKKLRVAIELPLPSRHVVLLLWGVIIFIWQNISSMTFLLGFLSHTHSFSFSFARWTLNYLYCKHCTA